MLLQTKVVFLSILMTGCASQQVQQQMLELQTAHETQAEQQQLLLVSQQESLEQLLEQQNQLQEVLEVNQSQLQKLLRASNKPKVKKTVKLQAKPPATEEPDLTAEVPAPQKFTLGRVELVWIDKLQRYLKARIDTGAKSSSIHATDIQYFERDGKQWVRFNMFTHKRIVKEAAPAKDGAKASAQTAIFEAPVVRTVKIKQASAEELDKRPVVKMRIRIGDYEDDVEFTLNKRSNMLYPVLIGRRFLQDVAIVDVGQVFIHKRKQD
ncbi:ATP-dependent zinc protease family protein [Marinagarivorans algicola]|uniref:ATP-dependent zinc protease family protein n=1 Tax=Marinagarivorans algicola TaxID=1513270 RepID=UPI0006B99597|nr:ATP-dependent zinc protease [Marinagarivorans algicola]